MFEYSALGAPAKAKGKNKNILETYFFREGVFGIAIDCIRESEENAHTSFGSIKI